MKNLTDYVDAKEKVPHFAKPRKIAEDFKTIAKILAVFENKLDAFSKDIKSLKKTAINDAKIIAEQAATNNKAYILLERMQKDMKNTNKPLLEQISVLQTQLERPVTKSITRIIERDDSGRMTKLIDEEITNVVSQEYIND